MSARGTARTVLPSWKNVSPINRKNLVVINTSSWKIVWSRKDTGSSQKTNCLLRSSDKIPIRAFEGTFTGTDEA